MNIPKPAPDLELHPIRQLLKRRILVLDGAMGTQIQALDLSAEDFGGTEYEGCNEYVTITRPELIRQIHENYLDAGADIVETNTFGGTPLVLGEFGLADKGREINAAAARVAKEAAAARSTPDRPRFVAGSMGPTTRAISVTGGITFEELRDTYRVQALGLTEGGADYLLVETIQDTLNCKAALAGIDDAFEELGISIPIALSCTIEPMGTMLAGQSIDSFFTSVEHRSLLYVGLNCSTGPRFMTDHLRTLSQFADCPVACMPNAGLPDEDGRYNELPKDLASVMGHFAENGWLNLAGGCCGTTPEYVREIAAAVTPHKPRSARPARFGRVSGIDFQTLEEDNRPLIVGERTNVIGSRAFKKLVAEGDLERASEVGRGQVRSGAHIVDVCLADPDRDEKADMTAFLAKLTRKIRVPLMVDSTDADVIEACLPLIQGKCIINSVNLEDGEERFEKVIPLARRFGAALVVGCIDEDPQQGMAVTVERKVAVARRSFELLTGKYGIHAEDLIFDPLVFPCGTGDQNYRGSAKQTIEGVRAIKEALPKCKTILGISNVSFGLPAAGREVLNSVFLYHCTQAGLDLAIVNSEKLVRYASIPDDERLLCDDLLFDRTADPIAAFAAHFKVRKAVTPASLDRHLPVETRLARHIIEGTRERLEEDLDEALGRYAPLDIINGPLMDGMNEVGRLFNTNQLIVAEVLQSAEAMKAAVTHLEPHMEKKDSHSRGTVMLATVKGDVHDIGKNLVDIILSNNGFKVVNLGIKVDPATLIHATAEHKPDIIGLSGLLVKSAQQMVVTASDLKDAGVKTPLLVGGAALTRKFTDTRIQPEYGSLTAYAKDAMQGLELANRIQDRSQREMLQVELEAVRASYGAAVVEEAPAPEVKAFAGRSVGAASSIPSPPDLKRHEVRTTISELLPYINPMMLYGKHLGLRGMVARLIEHGDEKALKLVATVKEVVAECEAEGLLDPRGVFRFYCARAEGETVVLSESPGGPEAARFAFPRQPDRERLCVADWLEPAGGRPDYMALFLTTAGSGVRQKAEALKEAGDYLKSHAIQALAIETAEACAEWLHQKLRTMWGIADAPELTMNDRFKARYHGIRVSFGYPACPDLELQKPLFQLLKPESLGVILTEGCMMEPEASVSALVFHHPEAKYFSAHRGAAVAEV